MSIVIVYESKTMCNEMIVLLMTSTSTSAFILNGKLIQVNTTEYRTTVNALHV